MAARGHAESAEQLIADSQVARDELLRRSGIQAYHAVGVSWGGKLVVAACVTDPRGLASMTLVTPGLFPKVGVSKEHAAEIGFSMLYEPEKLYDIPLDDPEFFTSDPEPPSVRRPRRANATTVHGRLLSGLAADGQDHRQTRQRAAARFI